MVSGTDGISEFALSQRTITGYNKIDGDKF